VALTPEAANVSGIQYIMDADKEEVEMILNGKTSKKKLEMSSASK
jgi:hypothetical protein